MNLTVTAPPHIKAREHVSTAMRDVAFALAPITLVALYFHGLNAALILASCVIAAMLTELVVRRAKGKQVHICDSSAIVTGLLVGLTFGPTASWTMAVLATVIAVGVAKELMGGLGRNVFNPALFGRASVILLAPVLQWANSLFATWQWRAPVLDAITTATPAALLKVGAELPGYASLFFAQQAGAMCEISPFFLLVGAAYLYFRGHICWRVPVGMMGTVFVLTLLLGHNPIQHLLIGGMFLGALFMATDWVTSPMTDSGKLIFAVGIGVLVVVFRLFLAPVEGVAFSILIMNAFVPLIDRSVRRRKFGQRTA